jgi:MFS family permease
VGLHHFLALSLEFYCVLISIGCYSACLYTFLAFSNDFLQAKYGYSVAESGRVAGILSIFSAVGSPPAGLAIDYIGARAPSAFIAAATGFVAYVLLAFTSASPVVAIVLAGFAFAVLPSTLFPMVADTVPEEAFTSVYALLTCFLNLLLAFSFFLAGQLSNSEISEDATGTDDALPPEAPPNYDSVLYFLLFYMLVTSIATFWLAKIDITRRLAKRSGGVGLVAALAGKAGISDIESEPLMVAPPSRGAHGVTARFTGADATVAAAVGGQGLGAVLRKEQGRYVVPRGALAEGLHAMPMHTRVANAKFRTGFKQTKKSRARAAAAVATTARYEPDDDDGDIGLGQAPGGYYGV